MKHFNLKTALFFFAGLCFFGGFNTAKAQVTAANARQLLKKNDWSFVENKGQLADAEGNLHSDIKYYSHNGGPDIYCRPCMISFVFSKIVNNADGTEADLFQQPGSPKNALDMRRHWEDEITNKKISTVTSRTDLVLLNSNPAAQIIGQDQQAYYENYYTSYTPEPGVNQAHTFKTIVYKNIYQNIDMLIHCKTGGLEYEFVVYPGGNVSDIQLQWNGLQNMEALQNGGLHYAGNMIDMQDSKPISFIPGGLNVPSNFVKNDNVISFSVANYDHTQTLTIDPTITWGTYLGGGSRNWGEAVWTDIYGNVLMCGPSTSPTTNISTTGAFQTSSGMYDAFLSKFSSGGALLWCTYYGGSGYNDGWGLSSDNLGDIFMGGATSSSSGIATSGSYQSNYGGGSYGGYIVKFRPNGSRVWATYYGSTDNDQILYIATDAYYNVYGVAWATTSTGLASSGAFQTANGGGYDAGLAKYDSSGAKQLWSTYYGGKGDEEVSSVACDGNGNALLVGYTTSSSAIATPGAFQTTFGGGSDGFVASFSPSGSLNWATYEGGSGSDIGWGIAADQSNNVYVDGQTSSSTGIANNIPYQQIMAGNSDLYLSKFSSTGTMIWSTYYGGAGTDIGNNLGLDPSGSILVAGNTTSNSGIATSGGYLTTLTGSQDALIGKFSPAGNLMYGSYYGAGSSDEAIDIHSDAIGNTYISGTTSSTSGIATSGGYQSSYSTAGDNAFLAGFFFHTYPNDAGIAIMKPGYCAGTQTITAMLENFGSNNLTSATIGWSLNGKTQTPISWTGNLASDSITAVTLGTFTFSGGTDTFKVWTSAPNGVLDSMPQNDTLVSKVLFVAYPKVNAGGPKKLCLGSSILDGPGTASGVTFSWTSNPSGFTSSLQNPSVSPTVTTTYYLTETTIIGGCAATDSSKITVGKIPTPSTGGSYTICYGGNVSLGAAAITGHTYTWSSQPAGFSSSISSPTANPTTSTVYYETEIDTAAGCLAYGNTTVTVNPEAKANAGGNQKVCPGASTTIGASAVTGHSYSWSSSPAGFTSTLANPTVSPDTITTYYLSDAITATGCTAGDSAVIGFNPLPAAKSGGNQTICVGSNTQLGSAAVSGDTYSWKSKPTGFTSALSDPTVSPTATTDYFITETITATGCTKTDTAIVTANPLPAAVTGGNQVICVGSSVQLGSGVTPGHVYVWSSKPAGFSSNSAFPTVSPTVTTTYYLTEIISATSCNKKDSAVVTVNSETAKAGPDSAAVCLGQADTLGLASVSGNTYSWTSNPTGFTSAAANPVVKPTAATTYYLKETNTANGCSGLDSAYIMVNPLPLADAGANLTVCAGASALIGDTTSANDSFSWISSPSGYVSNLANPTVNPVVTTTYFLIETNPNTGCHKTNYVEITVNPLPDAEWDITYADDITYLHATDSSLGRSSYLWNLGDGDTASGYLVKHLYPSNKPYSIRLTITGADGCKNALDSTVDITYSGIAEIPEGGFGLNVFPNPFQASASIEYNLSANGKIKIVLFDITGKQIGVITDENQAPGSYQFDINAEKYHLNPGMYLLQFIKDDQFVTKNLVKM